MINRIAVIFLAFLVASAATGIAIAAALLGPGWLLSGQAGQQDGFWALAFFAGSFSAVVVAVPLALVAVLAESFRLRSIVLYTLGGAAVMIAGYFLSGFAENFDPSAAYLPVRQEAAIAGGAGVVFGLVYWLLAGRKAGVWRDRT